MKESITEQEAKEKGCCNLTNPYSEHEIPLLERAVAQLATGNIDYEVVKAFDKHGKYAGIELWRSRKGFKFNAEEIVKNTKAPVAGERCL